MFGACSIRAHRKQATEGYWSETAQLFLKELRATDFEDYHIFDTRLAALVEELGEDESKRLSLFELDQTLLFLKAQQNEAEQEQIKTERKVS